MVPAAGGGFTSQFLITLGDSCASLDDTCCVFGEIWYERGYPASLDSLNAVLCDESGRPYVDIRVLHTHVLVDPFDDPPALASLLPPSSPLVLRPSSEIVPPRLDLNEAEAAAEEAAELASGKAPSADVLAQRKRKRMEEEAASRAVLLEMVGDLPSADVAPPDTALFVCKLNPITSARDLDIIFSRFGPISSCDIVRDEKTGASLCYGFINFTSPAAAETAYLKMDNVLIDDRRIRVDFSQSVAGVWNAHRRGQGKALVPGMEVKRHGRTPALGSFQYPGNVKRENLERIGPTTAIDLPSLKALFTAKRDSALMSTESSASGQALPLRLSGEPVSQVPLVHSQQQRRTWEPADSGKTAKRVEATQQPRQQEKLSERSREEERRERERERERKGHRNHHHRGTSRRSRSTSIDRLRRSRRSRSHERKGERSDPRRKSRSRSRGRGGRD